MKRVILDTNIYGRIAVDDQRDLVRNMISTSKIIVYGNLVIRKQLRATPKGQIDGINLRADLMRLYQEITRDKELDINKKEDEVADNYYKTYNHLGGITSWHKMRDDFLIVASASLHNMNIVVSDDRSTMLNELAKKSYNIVNSVLKIDIPRFIDYEEFKKEIRK